jgi:Tfp pilus assembly protein PilF
MPRGKRRTVWDHNEMGVFFYGRGAYDLAISEFTLAVEVALYPMASLHINLGAAYLGKKMYAEAETSIRRGLAIDGRSQNGHVVLARLLRETRKNEEALEEFERAHALDPDSPRGQSAAEEIQYLRVARGRARKADEP